MDANIALPAALIGDPVRAAMLMALMDGKALPASALACAAGASPQAASNHLKRLSEGGLIVARPEGRHRYYRLANAEVAQAVEALSRLAPRPLHIDPPVSPKARRLRDARSCYDHLAGRLGVAMADAFEANGWITALDENRFALTAAGAQALEALGVDVAEVKPRKGKLLRPCLDWTERRRHLAGPLAARLLTRLLDLKWLERVPGDRGLRLTIAGQQAFRDRLGVELERAAA